MRPFETTGSGEIPSIPSSMDGMDEIHAATHTFRTCMLRCHLVEVVREARRIPDAKTHLVSDMKGTRKRNRRARGGDGNDGREERRTPSKRNGPALVLEREVRPSETSFIVDKSRRVLVATSTGSSPGTGITPAVSSRRTCWSPRRDQRMHTDQAFKVLPWIATAPYNRDCISSSRKAFHMRRGMSCNSTRVGGEEEQCMAMTRGSTRRHATAKVIQAYFPRGPAPCLWRCIGAQGWRLSRNTSISSRQRLCTSRQTSTGDS